MCESPEICGPLDDIVPITQTQALDAIRDAQTKIPFAVQYTLRLLVVQFFREKPDAAEVADEELDLLYSGPAEKHEIDVTTEEVESDFEKSLRNETNFEVDGNQKVEDTIRLPTEITSSYGPIRLKC